MLFPTFETDEQYSEAFRDPELGVAAAGVTAARHGIFEPPERRIEGSNLLFRLGDLSWLKFYPPLFEEEFVAERKALEIVGGKLPIPVPEIMHEGETEGWPYIIVTHIEGTSFDRARDLLSPEERVEIARALGECLNALYRLPAAGFGRPLPDWSSFLEKQIDAIRASQQAAGEPWLSRMEEYLDRFRQTLLARSASGLIHADIHFEHVMLRQVDGRWKFSGIIDFADAMIGSTGYELVDPALWLFRSDAVAQHALFTSYGYEEKELGEEFSDEMMAWSLLHRFMRFEPCFRKELRDGRVESLEELAAVVFPVRRA